MYCDYKGKKRRIKNKYIAKIVLIALTKISLVIPIPDKNYCCLLRSIGSVAPPP